MWNLILPAVSMVVASKIIDLQRGRTTEEELKGLIYARHEKVEELRGLMGQRLRALAGTWLQKTLVEAPIRPEYPFAVPEGGLPWYKRPGILIAIYMVVVCYLLFVFLW